MGFGGQTVRDSRNPYKGGVGSVRFTVGAEGAAAVNQIKVTVKATAANGRTLQKRVAARVYLTESLTTLAVSGNAPSGTVAVAAKGTIVATITSKLVFDVVFDANGEFDLNITHNTTRDYYLVVVVDSQAFVSGVINFAQPTVVSKSPSGGTTAGGTALTITGTDFPADATVDIGGAAATSVVVVDSTTITCVTPARTAGAKAITVDSPTKGTSNTDVTFTYS